MSAVDGRRCAVGLRGCSGRTHRRRSVLGGEDSRTASAGRLIGGVDGERIVASGRGLRGGAGDVERGKPGAGRVNGWEVSGMAEALSDRAGRVEDADVCAALGRTILRIRIGFAAAEANENAAGAGSKGT